MDVMYVCVYVFLYVKASFEILCSVLNKIWFCLTLYTPYGGMGGGEVGGGGHALFENVPLVDFMYL